MPLTPPLLGFVQSSAAPPRGTRASWRVSRNSGESVGSATGDSSVQASTSAPSPLKPRGQPPKPGGPKAFFGRGCPRPAPTAARSRNGPAKGCKSLTAPAKWPRTGPCCEGRANHVVEPTMVVHQTGGKMCCNHRRVPPQMWVWWQDGTEPSTEIGFRFLVNRSSAAEKTPLILSPLSGGAVRRRPRV